MAPLRVLSAFEYGSLNGGEQSWLAVAELLRQDDVELCAAAPEGSPLASRIRAADLECLPLQVERGAAPDDERLLQVLGRYAAQQRLDLLHSNSLSMSRRVGRIADRLPCPTAGHLRDIIKLSRKAIADLNCNDRLLAVSDATRDFHVAQGLNPTRTKVVRNGVDLQRFRPGNAPALREQMGIPPEAFVAISIGQIGIRKGLDVTARAILDLHPAQSFCWLIVGERFSQKDEALVYERRVRELANQIGPERVRFLGVRDDVDSLLRSADLLIHSARQEPLGRVLLEAAAVGLPVLATEVGGAVEIFGSEESAQLVPVDDPQTLTEELDRLIRDPARRASLGAAARRRAVEWFSAEKAAAAFAAELRSAAKSHSAE